MIVSINNNNSDRYLNLFTDAYRFLKAIDAEEKTNYVDPNRDRFSSLAEYYGHMADLFNTLAYQYIMVPLDEDPFKIDLNKREITVPESFSKCASVQSDLLAETIIFVTDRYFDYMDLSTTEIFVQWITPDGVEGATRVEMIDLSESDKIKFAWPLNDIITKTPGEVKFSVRFFRLDTDSDAVVYSLNTLDNKIIIKPALQPEGPSIVERPVSDNTFKKAIINSFYSTEGIPEPVTPSYQEPGSDITVNPFKLESLEEADSNIINGVKVVGLKDNSVTLYAQAYVPDAGELRYEWYYKPEGSEVAYPCAAFPVENSDPIAFGASKDEYIALNDEDKQVRVPFERYYTMAEGNTPVLYTGDFPTDEALYTKFSAYTVDANAEDITGTYHVRAYNDIATANKVYTSSRYAASIDCLLPAPKDIVITTKLDDGAILVNNEAKLSLEVAADEYAPAVQYEWRMDNADASKVLNKATAAISTTDDPEFVATVPGWYSARVISTLNRKAKDRFTTVCKVTNKPEPPVVAFQGNETVYVEDDAVTLTVEASVKNTENAAAELLSDKLSYVWQIRPINSMSNGWTTIVDGDAGVSGQGTDVLTVSKDLPYEAASFRCLVINELNGKKAIFDHSGNYNNAMPELGEFKDEVPYVFEDNKSYTYTVVNIAY